MKMFHLANAGSLQCSCGRGFLRILHPGVLFCYWTESHSGKYTPFHSHKPLLRGLFMSYPLLSPGGKSKTNRRLMSAELGSSDASGSSHPHFVLFLPHLPVSHRADWRQLPGACQKGAFLLLTGVSGGCVRDRSFPHPAVVAFPRLWALRKPQRKGSWRWHGCTTASPRLALCHTQVTK